MSTDQPLGDRTGMCYSSTVVTKGRAIGIVVETGMNTEVGKIAKNIQTADKSNSTRLQKTLNKMYLLLVATSVACAFIVLAANKFVVNHDLGLYAVTTALSILPAGLTTMLTLSLVLGGQEMLKHHAIVRKLKCLETLGSITHIFSDKTGTLTQAEMTVVRLWLPFTGYFYVTANGMSPTGEVYLTSDFLEDRPIESHNSNKIDKHNISDDLRQLIYCCALCNTSTIHQSNSTDKENPESWLTSGTPTEIALQVLAHKFQLGNSTLSEDGWELLHLFEFDSTIKRMSALYQSPSGNYRILYTKGAPERVIALCNLDDINQEKVSEHVKALADKGLRVIALAFKYVKNSYDGLDLNDCRTNMESNLTFIGLTGIYDP